MAHPYLTYFEAQKEKTLSRIKNDTERYRKGYATLALANGNSALPDGARVRLTLKKHEFKFGCNIFMLDQFPDEEHNRLYRERFSELFNYAIAPLYWSDFEPTKGKPRFKKDSENVYRRPDPERVLDYCREKNISLKGHPLFWHCFRPSWLPNDTEEVMKLLKRRIKEIAENLGQDIPDFDAVNESISRGYNISLTMPKDYVYRTFDYADRFLPDARLFINETTDGSFGSKFCCEDSQYALQIKNLLNRGVRIDGIGLQYHMFWKPEDLEKRTVEFYNPDRLFDVLDTYGSFGRPLHISEITVPAFGLTDEQKELQAEITEWLYRIWFSHPQMEAIVWWNLVDGTAAYAPLGSTTGENFFGGGVLNYDMTDKPVYRTLRRLIKEEWHTDLTLEIKNGSVNFSGFYGDYDVEVECDGKVMHGEVNFSRHGSGNLKVDLQ